MSNPIEPLDSIASRHVGSLPLPIRTLLSAIGATERRGAALASYLLFESSYTRALIELGQIDTLNRRDEVLAFFDVGSFSISNAAIRQPVVEPS